MVKRGGRGRFPAKIPPLGVPEGGMAPERLIASLERFL